MIACPGSDAGSTGKEHLVLVIDVKEGRTDGRRGVNSESLMVLVIDWCESFGRSLGR